MEKTEVPTLGRILLFTDVDGMTYAAIVACVFDDWIVNLAVLNHNGTIRAASMVTHRTAGSLTVANRFWEWPTKYP